MSSTDALGIRDKQIWESIGKGPPGDGAELDVVVPGGHLLRETPHLLAVVKQDALLGPRAAGHLGHGQRREVGVQHVEAGPVCASRAGARAAGPAEVETGVEPAGGGGGGGGPRGRPGECEAGFGARVRGRGRGFGAESGGGGGGGRCCHPSLAATGDAAAAGRQEL